MLDFRTHRALQLPRSDLGNPRPVLCYRCRQVRRRSANKVDQDLSVTHDLSRCPECNHGSWSNPRCSRGHLVARSGETCAQTAPHTRAGGLWGAVCFYRTRTGALEGGRSLWSSVRKAIRVAGFPRRVASCPPGLKLTAQCRKTPCGLLSPSGIIAPVLTVSFILW